MPLLLVTNVAVCKCFNCKNRNNIFPYPQFCKKLLYADYLLLFLDSELSLEEVERMEDSELELEQSPRSRRSSSILTVDYSVESEQRDAVPSMFPETDPPPPA